MQKVITMMTSSKIQTGIYLLLFLCKGIIYYNHSIVMLLTILFSSNIETSHFYNKFHFVFLYLGNHFLITWISLKLRILLVNLNRVCSVCFYLTILIFLPKKGVSSNEFYLLQFIFRPVYETSSESEQSSDNE